MSDRTFQTMKALGTNLRKITFKFFPAGAADPTFSAIENPGIATITRTGVGAFLVTLSDSYAQLRGVRADLAKSAATPNWAQAGAVANVGTGTPVTIVIRTVDGAGAGVDEAAAADTFVSGEALFNDVKGMV